MLDDFGHEWDVEEEFAEIREKYTDTVNEAFANESDELDLEGEFARRLS